ncbi:hypothetical protein ACFWDI_26775 [Streptomyces sp. NPDC060064]|uniref:hypothetical protein n=1 Tax=Streptomyces sp. NPDC060064 TaxID=3347049 RepID=UPI003681B66A
MTTPTSDSSDSAWLLQVTIASAPAGPAHWEQQLQLLRDVAGYDPVSRTWTTFLGSFDARALRTLQCLYDVARSFGTRVYLEPVTVPASWTEPSFTGPELAALAASRADAGRPLGQLALA